MPEAATVGRAFYIQPAGLHFKRLAQSQSSTTQTWLKCPETFGCSRNWRRERRVLEPVRLQNLGDDVHDC